MKHGFIRQVSNGFCVDSRKKASICLRQKCRTHGEHVINVYPPLGQWINLPFKVSVGEGKDAVDVCRLRLVKYGGEALPNTRGQRTMALWEV